MFFIATLIISLCFSRIFEMGLVQSAVLVGICFLCFFCGIFDTKRL